MDLFGEGSIFQYLNRCATTPGKNFLNRLFTSQPDNAETIYKRQEAVKELKDHIELLQDFRASGSQ